MNQRFKRKFKEKAIFRSLISTMIIASLPAAANSNEENQVEELEEIEKISIFGRSIPRTDMSTLTPVQVLSGDELAHRIQGGLGETLSGLPGIHLDNFGGGASRPVIRGQTVPRIGVLSDGASMFDVSSVAPDHAITTDPLLLDAIEILRGPAATRYGGNALNGAINLIDSKIPKVLPEEGLSGAAELRLGTGDKEKAAAGRITVGLGSLALHAEGSQRKSEDYDIPDSYGEDKLVDSYANSSSYSFGASWITSKGYIGAAYTQQDSDYGLPGHSHEGGVCHTHGLDLHCESHGGYNDPFLNSNDDHTAFIKLRSERIDIRADYDDLFPSISHARLRLSYTDYKHAEVDGEILFSQYTNEAYDGRIELTHIPLFGFTGTFGVQYTDSAFTGLSENSAHTYTPYPSPEFVTKSSAIFLNERRSFGSIDLEVSARKSWTEIDAPYLLPDYTAEEVSEWGIDPDDFFQQDRDRWSEAWRGEKQSPLSASISAVWNFDTSYSTSLSFSHAERTPSVRELNAYGNSLATNSYELGLKQGNRFSGDLPLFDGVIEKANSINLTFRKAKGATQFEVGLFYQNIDDYIYARLIEEEVLESGARYRYLVYTPVDTIFTGIDGEISHQFTTASRVTIFGDYVQAELKNSDDNLPRIPPSRLGARYEWNAGDISADIEYYRTFDQDEISDFETETPGYNMFNATISYQFDMSNEQSVELYARGTNLTNELAFSHTSFVKDQSPLRGRNIVLGVRYQF